MAARPRMHARDSSGRKVSLLNDEPAAQESPFRSTYSAFDSASMVRSNSAMSIQSGTSSPHIPDLVRADSFDSNNTNDPLSPITPTSLKDFGRPSSYMGYKSQPQFDYREGFPRTEDYSSHQYSMPLPNYQGPRTSSYPEPQMYDDEMYQNRTQQERGPKRYPCRHRDTHNCDKTFTTSGHASRHSKIHTAEKGVVCTWKGCQKKFTRGDNMKQHLETHTKERSRSSAAQKNAAIRTLTLPAGVRKASSIDGRSSRPSSRNTNESTEITPVDPALYQQHQQQQPAFTSYGSPSATSAYYVSPISPQRESHQSGLDALAAIAASQYRP
ncbi:putative transcriptional regulator NRG1 [Cadophora sp. MPI-SDFR-AT-0126]|nr:putative transcriptional regulator NRG1 [Leotiomycetes sp. MPI-SDFR-AT-0126]